MKKKEITIPTIIGLFVAFGGLVTGLWLVRSQVSQNAQASAGEAPGEVRVTNIADDRFSVSWVTEKAVSGFVQYGELIGETDKVVADDRDQEKATIENYFTHHVTVSGLKSDTVYRFKIGSGKGLYDQGGQPYQIETAKVITLAPAADVAYGQVKNENGDPAEGALIYIQIPGTVMQSALAKTSGSWVVPLATARKYNLEEYASYDLKKAELSIEVQGGPMGRSQVTVTTENDSPVPDIVLGENINLADETDKELVILTPYENEKVGTQTPEIVGRAPAGTKVSIEIHSQEVINGEAIADSNGNFTFEVPDNLEPGSHTVSVTMIVDGIVKTVSKQFTVYAAGESVIPSYSATPSASITTVPTALPTASPTVRIISPTTTPLIIPTATLAPSPTPVTELENSGNTDTTWLILSLGLGLVMMGSFWYRRIGSIG